MAPALDWGGIVKRVLQQGAASHNARRTVARRCVLEEYENVAGDASHDAAS